jgi:hypothetical protein
MESDAGHRDGGSSLAGGANGSVGSGLETHAFQNGVNTR